MRNGVFYTIFFLSAALFNQNLNAQVHVNINVNAGVQPAWVPMGYERAGYYYFPDLDVYYNVPRRLFVYASGPRWIFSASLPYQYRSYDLYRGYKVVINDPYPYRHCDEYRERYGRHRGWQREDEDYHYEYRDHPGKHGRGHAYGHFKHHYEDD